MPALVKEPVPRTLFRMAVPMLAGTFAMNAYNLTDTWFVSCLGTSPLAAMGFSFPVVMLLTCLAGGLGTGVTTLVSHTIGRHDHDTAARITTHGFMLAMFVTIVLMVAGFLTIDPVFRRLGAEGETLGLITEYMRIWYAGALFMAFPMIGNGILIAMGDSRSAGRFMMLGTLLNLILDPIMIFGSNGIPAMGIAGAALATVIAQLISTVWLYVLMSKKHKLINLSLMPLSVYMDSMKNILRLGIPGIFSMILMPISASIITKILGTFGEEAVAACGAAGRIEMFAFVIPMALGISMMPFVSQNYGAGRFDRIHEAITLSNRFAILYGAFIAGVFYLGAPIMADVFTNDDVVRGILISYIRTIAFGYGMMEVHRYCGITLNGLHRPVHSTMLNAVRVLVLLVPFSLLGAHWWGIVGVFRGRLLTDLLVGMIGMIWVRRVCSRVEAHHATETADVSALQDSSPVVETAAS